ncbi:MerR family transcriptional regulator [Streptococcus ovuberis]|uniref:MerR family transcriptional regulator n=1 Tax=Streptococcus ovuberis TaxID=1936207 RepID=A0A7X6S2F3_9STRE|nr:MerR family transcriptional regulator [Streptococcus ovuberis]NKZ21181.1 MerR family transcriptional regulator [Streptococcus ovuberis]
MTPKTYTISEVAKRLNIPSSTLRYYDNQGILLNLKRDKNGNRLFDETDLDVLRHIHLFKIAGMPLKKIKRYFELFAEGDSTIPDRYELIYHQQLQAEENLKKVASSLKALRAKTDHYKHMLEKSATDSSSVE